MSQKTETGVRQSRDSESVAKNKCLGGCLALKSLAINVLDFAPLKNRDSTETVAETHITDKGARWEAKTVLDSLISIRTWKTTKQIADAVHLAAEAVIPILEALLEASSVDRDGGPIFIWRIHVADEPGFRFPSPEDQSYYDGPDGILEVLNGKPCPSCGDFVERYTDPLGNVSVTCTNIGCHASTQFYESLSTRWEVKGSISQEG